jgi:NADH oxidase (H2O2-forming)
VIVGLGTGGIFAIRAAQRQDRSVDITVIERRAYDMFSPCGLPYAIGRRVGSFEDLKHTLPTGRRLRKLLRHEVRGVDVAGKVVHAVNLDSGEAVDVPYDSLILATGSHPVDLGIPGAREFMGRGVHIVTNPENGAALQEHALRSRRAVVVGGGAVGMEIGSALKSLGLEVFVTKRSLPAFQKNLDPDMGDLVKDYAVSRGCDILFGQRVDGIVGSDRVEGIIVGGTKIEADIVVLAVGGEPEVTLAREAGLRIEDGAIWTNDRMETSVTGVYAIGECALTFSGVDASPTKIDLATTAFRQAYVGGANAAGGDMVYSGALGTFVSHIGELEVASTGFNTEAAEAHGMRVVSGKAKLGSKPKWMPGGKDVTVKVVAEASSGRIVGGQAVGEEGAAWRVNMLAMAIKHRVTLEEFAQQELAYCPAVSDLYDPLLAAVDIALQRMRGG